MADATQYTFSHQALTKLLIQEQGLHEGIWMLAFQLGIGNGQAPSPTGGDTVPATIISILSVGLQKADKEGPMALDAATPA